MINFDEYTNENKKVDNFNWPCIPDHPYRILIIGGSGTGKTNALLNLINNQQDIDKIYLYAKDPYEHKYQYLINKGESVGLKHFNDPKAFIILPYFKVPKDVRNNSTHFFIMKIPNKRERQQIAINHSSDINTKDFIEIYRKCTDKPYSFLVIDTTPPSNNSLRFRKSLSITNDDYQRSN